MTIGSSSTAPSASSMVCWLTPRARARCAGRQQSSSETVGTAAATRQPQSEPGYPSRCDCERDDTCGRDSGDETHGTRGTGHGPSITGRRPRSASPCMPVLLLAVLSAEKQGAWRRCFELRLGRPRGFELKQLLVKHLGAQGHTVSDCGTSGTEAVDYPFFAEAVAGQVASGACDFGIVVDGAGIGSAMPQQGGGILAGLQQRNIGAEQPRAQRRECPDARRGQVTPELACASRTCS